ncbi:MAG: hypothetical protein ACXW3Z_03795 [Limisphaerales bacterium]
MPIQLKTPTPWKFDQPPNCAVFTIRNIVKNGAPILHVTHDADDHGWQFLGLEDADETQAMIVGLAEMLALDPTLQELFDLPVGWHAWRKSKESRWSRGPNDHSE